MTKCQKRWTDPRPQVKKPCSVILNMSQMVDDDPANKFRDGGRVLRGYKHG